MATVAEQLRAAREASHLTVEQIADLTKIRTDHIRALEEGNFNLFPAPIYIRGSVKNYAQAVKLEAAPLLATLAAELDRTEKYSEPPPLVEAKKTIVDDLTLLLAKVNWKIGLTAVAAVALVVILIVSVWAWRHHHQKAAVKLPPARVQPARPDNTLPLPRR